MVDMKEATYLLGDVQYLLMLNEEFTVDLGSGLHWGKLTVLCLCPVTSIFQLKIRWAEVLLCLVRVR
jgi:hypothetical protein